MVLPQHSSRRRSSSSSSNSPATALVACNSWSGSFFCGSKVAGMNAYDFRARTMIVLAATARRHSLALLRVTHVSTYYTTATRRDSHHNEFSSHHNSSTCPENKLLEDEQGCRRKIKSVCLLMRVYTAVLCVLLEASNGEELRCSFSVEFVVTRIASNCSEWTYSECGSVLPAILYVGTLQAVLLQVTVCSCVHHTGMMHRTWYVCRIYVQCACA